MTTVIIYQCVKYFEKIFIKNASIHQQFSGFQKEARKIVVSGHCSSEGARHL